MEQRPPRRVIWSIVILPNSRRPKNAGHRMNNPPQLMFVPATAILRLCNLIPGHPPERGDTRLPLGIRFSEAH
jgi:hypothetical protein